MGKLMVSAIFNAVSFGTQPILGYNYGTGNTDRVTCISCVAFLCFQIFPSIGKGGIGAAVFLSRQVFFPLPLILIFPLLWGIDGVLWAGPIADGLSGISALFLVHKEMKKL